MNARCSPAGILTAYAADECDNSSDIAGRPGLPCWTFQVQNNRNPFRCQAMTVSGLTTRRAESQSVHTCDSPTQNKRSELCNCRRFLVER